MINRVTGDEMMKITADQIRNRSVKTAKSTVQSCHQFDSLSDISKQKTLRYHSLILESFFSRIVLLIFSLSNQH